MTDNFNNIYENLYYDYIYNASIRNNFLFNDRRELNFIRIIHRAIDKANKNDILRSDAKYFLLVNFHHLVARPLIENLHINITESVIKLENLEVAVEHDIKLIIDTSYKEHTGFSDTEKLSGHAIITIVNSLWQELSTMKLEIWG